MRGDLTSLIRSFGLMIGLLLCLVALAPFAAAQTGVTRDCTDRPAPRPASNGLSGHLGAHGERLLPNDGSGFFAPHLDALTIRSASDSNAQASRVRKTIETFYAAAPPVFVSSGEAERAIVIDSDVAVPGQPTVFTMGGVLTLHLHSSTAASDLAELLDVPTFVALTPACDTERSNLTSPPLSQGALAYVARPDLPKPPLADTTSTERWPIAVGTAAALVAVGSVVVRRRDDDVDEARTSTAEIPEADPGLLAALDQQRVDVGATKPRVIYVDRGETLAEPKPAGRREIDLRAKRRESRLTRQVERIAADTQAKVMARDQFAQAITAEWSRSQRGGKDGAVASLTLSELDAVRLRLGANAAHKLFRLVAAEIAEVTRSIDVIGVVDDTELAVLMPEASEADARGVLDAVARAITTASFTVGGERVLLTPATGFAMLSDAKSAPDLVRAIESARALSMLNMHLEPERWTTATSSPAPAATTTSMRTRAWATLRTPFQILLTVIISWVLPFFAYLGMYSAGIDISFVVYVGLVISLILTGAFILLEGFMAVNQKEPPEEPASPYPVATALIAAYLPNEAATVIETIDAFLKLDYPNDVQIILAYNTPERLPVEDHLDAIALMHPNFVPVRIVGSNSKAQNVNAALSMADGEFIGMFDADHQPRPDAFTRAWRWLDDGYDVVQGHCLTRNGDAGFLAKMIAVEFESIYAVAHPGRAKMHRFGVFGGSNGFWRTELLHETRMRGTMLTEDIDSSMRVIERGFKIRSDRDLVSRELATTTFKQIWHQRMRWAQGWFQVTIEHMKFGMRSQDLSVRQKVGLFHLLGWREIYPWLSQQLFPLLAFWAVRAGGLGQLDWTVPIFVATTIFTFSIGPLQTLFAYRLADPEIKQHKSWFVGYLLFTSPFYTEYKNLISRVAHIKQFMGESNWRVTPRDTGV